MAAYGGQVPICMRCGDRDIRQQSLGDGLWPAGGEGIAWACDACGHIGAPFLVEPRDVDHVEARWASELDRTAGELDDDRWATTSGITHRPDGARPRGFAVAFLGLGVLFLLPGLIEITHALLQETLWAALRAFVGTGWLNAIGLVLFVVGLRLLSPPVPLPVDDPEPAP